MMELERMKEAEEEGLLQGGVHKELTDEIISLTDDEIKLLTRLLASSQT